MTTINTQNAGLYLRLSRDDGTCESASIANQRDFLVAYCEENNIIIFDIYIDDGYTGTNFDRPNFKRMIKDIEDGIINTVIVKDMSRLGRDYIDTGYYIEKFFPGKSIRFIAINDGVDTFSNVPNDITPFKAVLNDMYAKDISKKIKATFRTKMKEGYFLAANAPYGYKINPERKGSFIVDANVAHIVKRIFRLFLDGNTYVGIANTLTSEGVETPSAYKNRVSSNKITNNFNIQRWLPTTIGRMLSNETYIGAVVQNKTSKISYKINRYRANPRNAWIVVPNKHEPIIDQETFNIAQELMLKNVRVKGERINHLLSGIVYCGECGRKMSFTKGGGGFFTVCQTYKKYRNGCTSHMVKETNLEEFVLHHLKGKIEFSVERKKLFEIIKKIDVADASQDMKKEENSCMKRLDKIQKDIQEIYKDKLDGLLSEVVARELISEMDSEYKRVQRVLADIDMQKRKIKCGDYEERATKVVDDFLNLRSINTTMIRRFINRIVVYDDKSIEIAYTFKESS